MIAFSTYGLHAWAFFFAVVLLFMPLVATDVDPIIIKVCTL
jgi:hypothetical protein